MKRNVNATMIDDLSIPDLASMDAGTLAHLDDDLASQAKVIAARKVKFQAALERRFGGALSAALSAKGSDTGTVHLPEDEIDISVTVPKTVDWDQAALTAALDKMPVDKARHYAKAKFSVDERKFDAAPPEDKAILATARTVKPGKPSFSFKVLAAEAA